MITIRDRIDRGDTLLSDGAMGTMLFKRGLKAGECPEKFNLDHPEILTEIARLYLEAGSDIISTNTFGGSPLKLAQYGLDEKTEEINAAAIRAARKAVGAAGYIAVSIGPCGRLLKPYGDTEPEDVRKSFERQIRSALKEGVDAVFIETMTDLSEAVLAVSAARSLSKTIPVSATMTFDVTSKGFYTIMGVTVEQACRGLTEAGTDLIGSNCGNGIENMVKIAAEFCQHSSLPVIIQSNAGLPDISGGAAVYSETPEFMANGFGRLVDMGVRVIGGCCGTTPEHIVQARKTIDERGQ